MKSRKSLVSNSSSTSFTITTTEEGLTLEDFVRENPQILEDFLETYPWYKGDPHFTQEQMLLDAKRRGEVFPQEKTILSYGDEDGDTLGHIFDYALRRGGRSARFQWSFHRFQR